MRPSEIITLIGAGITLVAITVIYVIAWVYAIRERITPIIVLLATSTILLGWALTVCILRTNGL